MPETLTIRPATRADIPAIDALLARAYPRLLRADYPPSVLVTAIPLISRAQPGLIASGTYYVAEAAEGRILGVGGWTQRDPAGGRKVPGQGSIRHFGTDPDATRQGVARTIMKRCLADAAGKGIELMLCYATRTAVPFYTSAGFIPRAEVEIELQAGIRFPAIRMDRPIP